MNPEAILSLISELYSTVARVSAENAELKAKLEGHSCGD
jgi:hypothetical protein